MLLGVIREAGELDFGASPVSAATGTTGPSSVGSVWQEKAGMSLFVFEIVIRPGTFTLTNQHFQTHTIAVTSEPKDCSQMCIIWI